SVKLSGGGAVLMNAASDEIIVSSAVALINVNNIITGPGSIDGAGTLANSGTIRDLSILTNSVTNAGLIEGTAALTGQIADGFTTNLGTLAALGGNARLRIINDTVTDSTTKALILASGNGARVDLSSGVTISGGTLKTSAGGAIAAVDDDTLNSVTV